MSAPSLPLFGLIAVVSIAPRRTSPSASARTCGKVLKLYVQVCPRCGTDLYLPDPSRFGSRASWGSGEGYRHPSLRATRSHVRTIALAKPTP